MLRYIPDFRGPSSTKAKACPAFAGLFFICKLFAKFLTKIESKLWFDIGMKKLLKCWDLAHAALHP